MTDRNSVLADVQMALCCPGGCVRLDDCWRANRKEPGGARRLRQAEAIMHVFTAWNPAQEGVAEALPDRALARDTSTPSPSPEQGIREALEDAFAEIEYCINSVQGALRHRQQPQDYHFHTALKACRDARTALSSVGRGGGGK